MRETARPVRVAMTLEQCWHRVPGGTATAALGLAAALAARPERDVEVVGVAARHGTAIPETAFRPPVPVAQLPLPRRALYEAWHLPGPLRWPPVERATGPVDVVHATTAATPPSPSAPLVVTIHDLAFLSSPGSFTRNGVRFFRRGTALARRHARVVVVPSEATAAECRGAGFDPARIRVVPWGHDARPASTLDVERARAAYGLPERYVLFVGTQEPRKNLGRLVRAWRRAGLGPDVPLVLVGPSGWGDGTPEADGVVALGFVPGEHRDALYAGAAAVAYPSLREGFGLPVLEAMAQSAPVVTSSGTATAEVAGDAALLVDPFDEAAIAAALRDLLDDGDAARALGDRARARAREFTWARCAAGYADAYREALG